MPASIKCKGLGKLPLVDFEKVRSDKDHAKLTRERKYFQLKGVFFRAITFI